MNRNPATDPSPTTRHLHPQPVEPPAQVVRHERCQFQECPYPASWSCRSACPDGDHRPIKLCKRHAERKYLAERCDGRHECHQHRRTFDSAYLWVRL